MKTLNYVTTASTPKEIDEAQLRLEKVAGISGGMLVLEVKHQLLVRRIMDTTKPYTTGDSAAPKAMGINDTQWLYGQQTPYQTQLSDGSTYWVTPIHGWPSNASSEDSGYVPAESPRFQCAEPPKHWGEVKEPQELGMSQLQGRAISALIRTCIEKGVRPTFSEQDISRYVRDYISKYRKERKPEVDLNRFA